MAHLWQRDLLTKRALSVLLAALGEPREHRGTGDRRSCDDHPQGEGQGSPEPGLWSQDDQPVGPVLLPPGGERAPLPSAPCEVAGRKPPWKPEAEGVRSAVTYRVDSFPGHGGGRAERGEVWDEKVYGVNKCPVIAPKR